MNTYIVDAKDNIVSKEDYARLAGIIKTGGLVAFPTETVYGLGANALDEDAAAKIYAAKGRPSDNPLIAHISDLSMLDVLAIDIPDEAYALARNFWPGPLTMILNKSGAVPLGVTGGLDTVAVRLPDSDIARALIQESGVPIAAPSANISGRPSPTEARYVIEEMSGKIDAIVAAGSCDIGVESTIIDLTVETPVILRPGFITPEQIESVIGEVLVSDKVEGAPKAPGMKYRHYAPEAGLVIVKGDGDRVVDYINNRCKELAANGRSAAVITTDAVKDRYEDAKVISLGDISNPREITRHLFSALRECDELEVDEIYSEFFGDEGVFLATDNRLTKAAGHNIIVV